MKKVIKRILLGLVLLIPAALIILLANNLIMKAIYSTYQTDSDNLSSKEIELVKGVYDYLGTDGTSILPGFDGSNIDLIIFNDKYEFLICRQEADSSWEFLEKNEKLGKYVYRRTADNPQAFTVYTNGEWVGSMSTKNYFIKEMSKSLNAAGLFGYLIPPQVFDTDEEHFKGVIIHEMSHALEAIMIEDRLKKDQTISNVSSYDRNAKYQDLIKKEGEYIENAMKSEDNEEVEKYARLFLDTRKQRQVEAGMTSQDIRTEKEFEWLEGVGRYAEYLSSTSSKSTIRNNLDNIRNKINEGGDERFYALGMAQAIVLDKLGYDWKQNIFTEDFTFEAALEQALAK
jgi:hypothetical protein